MVEVFAGILGGVGLLFFGMWMLSENLKAVVGPRLRMLASRLADNRFAAFGWGSLAGAITQSSLAVTFITVSMVRSGRRLVGAVLAEQHDEWAEAHRYLTIPNVAGKEAPPTPNILEAAA